MGANRFSRELRLLTAADYKQVFDQSQRKASHRHLLLLATANELDHYRLGLVIAKKNVKLAVQRNRIKRLAREFFRHQARLTGPEGQPHFDVVLLTRRGIDVLDNEEVSTILRQQWQKLTATT
ncbi:ribonuclease P protein component [Halieaceae bacterium IMCC14734]|uniref:Ribonuclease P protein component n=1 Tax=Candidatus Litorirhabdus singularis TaxID=2518993 RepID=A0ABT3TCF3_9GAMM|nr:ribonuclease P protein component [Candidatus Litorirhabdus singularis]MCX2979971.1 ribonuclease P protein component [Candidatus Litorirhabdus singularis]